MKKLTILIALALIIQATIFSQPRLNDAVGQACLSEGITFTTQAQIDNFQTNHPNCSEIEGDVEINGSNIINLNGLGILTSIGGDLLVKGNDVLSSITGLDNLTFVGGDIRIYDNTSLISLTGLENITSIEGDLNIGFYDGGFIGNPSLSNLTGLDNLTFTGGNLQVISNSSLSNLTGLDNLKFIGEDLIFTYNYKLNSLTGLGNLDSIGGSLYIGGDNVLTSLTGLGNLTSIGGSLEFFLNDSLTSLTGLDNLTSIGGSLWIRSNNALTSLTGLEDLNSIGGSISIENNTTLSNLDGLNNIDAGSISNLLIYSNKLLTNCAVENICQYLSSPNGTVYIFSNAPGCNTPDEIASACGFTMPCLPYGNYYFKTQAEIDNFQANYPGCTDLEGEVSISGNDITNLNGLSGVTSIGGKLIISSNYALTSISALYNLNSIGGDLWISSNYALTSLSGLDHEIFIGGNLDITFNESLDTCEAQSICDYLISPNGDIVIHYNAEGCNSQKEVEEACDIISVEEINPESIQGNSEFGILSFPNPFSNSTTIEYELKQPTVIQIAIYNHLGKQIEVIQQTQSAGKQQVVWNAEGLPSGVYYCVLKTESGMKTKKMIKMK